MSDVGGGMYMGNKVYAQLYLAILVGRKTEQTLCVEAFSCRNIFPIAVVRRHYRPYRFALPKYREKDEVYLSRNIRLRGLTRMNYPIFDGRYVCCAAREGER